MVSPSGTRDLQLTRDRLRRLNAWWGFWYESFRRDIFAAADRPASCVPPHRECRRSGHVGPPAAAQRRPSATLPVSGNSVPPLREFDELLFDYLRRNQSIPGASLAIARQGRVIYARAFGWASLEEHAAAQPNSLFRVASVSKTLTAAAIVLLVQRGRLKLSEPAFPLLRLEKPPNKPTPADPRLDGITIHHLLCHTGGWARTTAENPFETWKGFDPMFFPVEIARTLEVPSPASPRDIVRFMLTRPLDFDPGTRYAYSNFWLLRARARHRESLWRPLWRVRAE